MNAASTERAYRWVKNIVDALPTTKQRELQWAEVRPDPPRHMNLALDPRPRHFGRLCRFRAGDAVRVVHQEAPRTIVTTECPEVNPEGWSHCSGNDAIYNLDNGDRRGDIELSFAHLTEARLELPSGRWVRVTVHNRRLVALVDDNHKPIGAEDVELGDWEFLFHTVETSATLRPHA